MRLHGCSLLGGDSGLATASGEISIGEPLTGEDTAEAGVLRCLRSELHVEDSETSAGHSESRGARS